MHGKGGYIHLFNEQISNEQDWEGVFQSIPIFMPLIENIFMTENLPFSKIENLTPGTNAVFKAGRYVIKIYAPDESGIDQRDLTEHGVSYQTDLFAIQRANSLNIPALKKVANGFIEDKYLFYYIITEYIENIDLPDLTDAEKITLGRKLRNITDIMNTPCEPFNNIDVINDAKRWRCWDNYPESFIKERLAYIKSNPYGENVFVYGDLCGDNILLTPDGEVYIIDHNAVLAPKVYEHAALALDSGLDPVIMKGFFEDYTRDDFIETCLSGLLILDYDPEYVEEIIGTPDNFHTPNDLRESLKRNIKIVPA